MARFELPGDPERIAGTLSRGVLSHPQALCAFLAHLKRRPIGLLLTSSGMPDEVSRSFKRVSEVFSKLSESDRRCLAFLVILNHAKLTDVRAAGLALPRDFVVSLDKLAHDCLLSASDDCIEVPELVAEALVRVDPLSLEQIQGTVVRELVIMIANSVAEIDVALSRILPPIVTQLAVTGSWVPVKQITDPQLLDRLNERGHWEAYIQLLRLRIEAADHLGESAEAVIMRYRLARKLAQEDDLDSAWSLLQTAQDMLGDDGPAALWAMLCQHRALLAYMQNDDRTALADTRASAALYADAGDARGVLEARKLEGNVLLRGGDYQAAANAYLSACAVGEVQADLKHCLEVETSLSLCEMKLGMSDEAEQRLKRVLRQIRESGVDSELPRVLLTSALLAEQCGRRSDALQFARRAIAEPARDAAVRLAAERLVWRLERFGQRAVAPAEPAPAEFDE